MTTVWLVGHVFSVLVDPTALADSRGPSTGPPVSEPGTAHALVTDPFDAAAGPAADLVAVRPGMSEAIPPPDLAPAPNWSVPVAHAGVVVTGMRISLSLIWPEPYDLLAFRRNAAQFGRAYRALPEFRRNGNLLESDGDPWVINVVGHGLFGTEVYGRVRQCGGSPLQALAFTAGTSAVWEYGIESLHKRPSTIDLVATPVLGLAFGELRYAAQRWLGRRRPGWLRSLARAAVDPFGEFERRVIGTRC